MNMIDDPIAALRFAGIPNNKAAHKRISEEFEVRRQAIAAKADARKASIDAQAKRRSMEMADSIREVFSGYQERIAKAREAIAEAARDEDFGLVRQRTDTYTALLDEANETHRSYIDRIRMEEIRRTEEAGQIAADKAAALSRLAIEMKEAREALWIDALRIATDTREAICREIAAKGRFESDPVGTDLNRETGTGENN